MQLIAENEKYLSKCYSFHRKRPTKEMGYVVSIKSDFAKENKTFQKVILSVVIFWVVFFIRKKWEVFPTGEKQETESTTQNNDEGWIQFQFFILWQN